MRGGEGGWNEIKLSMTAAVASAVVSCLHCLICVHGDRIAEQGVIMTLQRYFYPNDKKTCGFYQDLLIRFLIKAITSFHALNTYESYDQHAKMYLLCYI